jgi:membrane fusion protein (multidrug efflux system)
MSKAEMSEAEMSEAEPIIVLAAPASEAKKPPAWRRPALVAAAVVVLLAVAGWVTYAQRFEDTDDAQVDGDISAISPRVNGTVVAVHFVDNQPVKRGDLLVEIDPRDFQVALQVAQASVEQAEAQFQAELPMVEITSTSNSTSLATTTEDLATARAEFEEAKSSLDQLRAQLVQAVANNRYAQQQIARGEQLFSDEVITQADLDQRSSAADANAANVQSLRQAVAAAEQRVGQKRARIQSGASRLTEVRLNNPRQLDTRKANLAVRQAALDVARAQLEQAELNLSYTKVLAPVDGIAGKKSVNVGDRVQPGQQLAAITQTGRLWITANFRETQLARLKPGQRASIYVDAIGRDVEGTVESIGAATGARFSLLPPENATGNYVKVVQRLPVRIAIGPGQPGIDRLRPGMSVEPKVRVQ